MHSGAGAGPFPGVTLRRAQRTDESLCFAARHPELEDRSSMMMESLEWTCPACGAGVASDFCPMCGERRPHPQELTLRGLLHQTLRAVTSVDGRLLRTVRNLVWHPGRLTIQYVDGARKPYVSPIALFLVANVLFVAMESITHSNIFSTPLYEHLHNQAWSHLAERLVADRLEATGRTFEAYAPVFDRAVAAHAKSLVILMVLPFSLLLPLLFRKQPQPFAAHVVFSLHFHAFLLVLMSVALTLPAVDLLAGGVGLGSQLLDDSIGVGLLVLCAIYLFFAMKPVYGDSGVRRIFKTATLVVAAVVIFLGYRFTLLILTLYST
jgi:Protein of unknown function (DUF3667)